MIRCTRCIYPTTRPDAHFDDEGVCSGCRSFEARQGIDWGARHEALEDLLAEAQTRKAPYDVVIPISGGKDSSYQVITLVAMGAKVLAVNAATDMLSDVGRRNLDNLKRFCDVIEWTPCIDVRKKLVRIGLRRVGDMSYPEHCAIWSIPTRVAALMGIPLVVWGEQPQRELTCPEGIEPATNLDGAWVSQFGGMNGLRLSDLVGEQGLTEADLEVYRFPASQILDRAKVKGIWLGDYVDWDGWKNGFVVQHYGFEVLPHPVETSLGNYENLDNHVTALRDFMRTLKFGYTRATDIACAHIRRGRLTREEGLMLEAKSNSWCFPWTSLGKPIEEVLSYFGITLIEYQDECKKWMNPEIFSGFNRNWTPVSRHKARNGARDAHHTGPAQ